MPQTLYLLAYDSDDGNREDWSVFYTPLELFKTEEDRQKRMDYLKNHPEWENREFHTEELTVLEGAEITSTDPAFME
jgi:hypothetical protein